MTTRDRWLDGVLDGLLDRLLQRRAPAGGDPVDFPPGADVGLAPDPDVATVTVSDAELVLRVGGPVPS